MARGTSTARPPSDSVTSWTMGPQFGRVPWEHRVVLARLRFAFGPDLDGGGRSRGAVCRRQRSAASTVAQVVAGTRSQCRGGRASYDDYVDLDGRDPDPREAVAYRDPPRRGRPASVRGWPMAIES